jgi:hypothetical protein
MSRRTFENVLGGLLVEYAGVDRAFVHLAECEDRRQCHAAIAPVERTGLQKREYERCNLVGEQRIGLVPERGDLWALHRVEKAELRLDHSGVRLRPAEFDADGFVQLDQILNRQVPNATVSP